MKFNLLNKPKHFRSSVNRFSVGSENVDRTGGDYGAGLIKNVSVITAGVEALGHEMWIDGVFCLQVCDFINATAAKGVKSRFTHPNLSGDGLGKHLGKLKNASFDGEQVFADLHLSSASHSSPDGDLGGYVMDLAEKDSDVLGLSICFDIDEDAMNEFIEFNEVSPDPRNIENYPHARASNLSACDVVDEPAANPQGLFHRGQEIVQEADALLNFTFGFSKEKPKLVALSIDADRVASYLHRYLEQNKLCIIKKELGEQIPNTNNMNTSSDTIVEDIDQDDVVEVEITTDPDAETEETESEIDTVQVAEVSEPVATFSEIDRFKSLLSAFSDFSFVAEKFIEGKTVEECQSIWDKIQFAKIKAENEALSAEMLSLKKQLNPAPEAVKFGGNVSEQPALTWEAKVEELMQTKGMKKLDAMKEIGRTHPTLFKKNRN